MPGLTFSIASWLGDQNSGGPTRNGWGCRDARCGGGIALDLAVQQLPEVSHGVIHPVILPLFSLGTPQPFSLTFSPLIMHDLYNALNRPVTAV